MKNAKFAKKYTHHKRFVASIAVSAALAVTAALPAMAADANDTTTPTNGTSHETTNEDTKATETDTTNQTSTEGEEETKDLRTDNEKHADNEQTVQDNKETVENNNETLDQLLPDEQSAEEDTEKDTDTETEKSETEQMVDDLKQQGEELSKEELPDVPEAPTGNVSQSDADEYKDAVKDYNDFVEDYNKKVEDYNDTVDDAQEKVDEANAETDKALADGLTEDQEKVEQNDDAIDAVVDANKEVVDANAELTPPEELDEDAQGALSDGKQNVDEAGEQIANAETSDALKALAAAKEDLAAYREELQALDTTNMSSEEIAALEELLANYAGAVDAYAEAIDQYNDDVDTYLANVQAYNALLSQYVANYNKTIQDDLEDVLQSNDEKQTSNQTTVENNNASMAENLDQLAQNGSISKNDVGSVTVTKKENVQTLYIQKGDTTYTITTTLQENEDGSFTLADVTIETDGQTVSLNAAEAGLNGVALDLSQLELDPTDAASVSAYNAAIESYLQSIAQIEQDDEGSETLTDGYNYYAEQYNAFTNLYVQAMKDYSDINNATPDYNEYILAKEALDAKFAVNSNSTLIKSATGKTYTAYDGTESTVSAEEYDKLEIAIRDAHAALEAWIEANPTIDLNDADSVAAYNAVIEQYNNAVTSYNNFAAVCMSTKTTNNTSKDESVDAEAKVEMVDQALYLSTETGNAEFYLVKSGTVPLEQNTTGYYAAGYIGVGNGTVTKSSMYLAGLTFDSTSADRVQVVNLYTEGEDGSYLDRSGNVYTANAEGYLCSADGTPVTVNEGDITAYYKLENGSIYVVNANGDYATGIKSGYVRADVDTSKDIIVDSQWNTQKFNFSTQEELEEYFKNVYTTVGTTPQETLDSNIASTTVYSDEIKEAYADGNIGVLWYVVKDKYTGTSNTIHVDGVLYWKHTLEIVTNDTLSILSKLNLVKKNPTLVDTETENITIELLDGTTAEVIGYTPLSELVEKIDAESGYEALTKWEDAIKYIAPLEKLEELTPIEGEEVTVTPTQPPKEDPDDGDDEPSNEDPDDEKPGEEDPDDENPDEEETPTLTPDEEELIRDILDQITPLVPDLVDVSESDVPLAELEFEEEIEKEPELMQEIEELGELLEENVPLSEMPNVAVPKTGDPALAWGFGAIFSALGLFGLGKKGKKREE